MGSPARAFDLPDALAQGLYCRCCGHESRLAQRQSDESRMTACIVFLVIWCWPNNKNIRRTYTGVESLKA
jgi:hypothetical protein